jgi:hypothetical protein
MAADLICLLDTRREGDLLFNGVKPRVVLQYPDKE